MQTGAILVTGASTGIGRAIALLLDRSGYKVFAGVRTSKAAQDLQDVATDQLVPVMLDVTSKDQIASAFETIRQTLDPGGSLAALINNAGISIPGPLEALPIEAIRRQLDVNLIGTIAVTQTFLDLLTAEGARIVNIGSTAGFAALPFLGAYSCTKAALEAFSTALRRELAVRGISVAMVVPGFTETPIWDKGYGSMDRLMAGISPEMRARYEEPCRKGQSFFEQRRHAAVDPQIVAAKVLKVLNARRVKPLYLVGLDTRLIYMASKWIPERVSDWFIGKHLSGK